VTSLPDAVHQDAHLSTAHLLKGLKGRTVSGGIVTTLMQVVLLMMNLGSVVALARLLTPQDFGLVGMVFGFMSIFRVFNDAGLSVATIQREGITHAQVSNLFWTNVALGGMITLVVALAAPVIARFYGEPRLIAVTLLLSLTFLLTSSSVQHMALLKRQMRFSAIALIQLASVAVGIGVAMAMAWFEFGYWCLVGMQISTPLVALVMTWLTCPWRPQLPVRNTGTRSLLNFGANITVSGFLWSLSRGIDSLLIGRFFGSEALGFYTRTTALINRPMEQAIPPLEAIFVPALARLQTQAERYRRVAFRIFDSIALVSLPVSAMLLPLAQPVSVVLLGQKWEGAAPIFAAFSLYALYIPMVMVAGWLLSSQGRGRDFLVLSSFTSTITVVSFLVGLRFGPVGVAASFSLSCLLIQLPVTYWVAGKAGLVTTRDLWWRFFSQLPLWVVVFTTTFLVRLAVVGSAPFAQLLVCGAAGVVAYATFICLYRPSREAAWNLYQIGRDWMKGHDLPGKIEQ